MTTDKGFRWRRARPGDRLRDIEPVGWDLNLALRELCGMTWKRRLVTIRDGKVIARGPWRKGHDAIGHFSNTIAKGKVGDHFRVWGRTHRIGRVRLERYFPGLQARDRAFREVGTPYIFGAANGPEDEGPDRFDCSGFAMWAWEPWVALPHGAVLMQMWGATNNKNVRRDQLRAGDLVLFNFPNDRGLSWPRASHVGLFNEPSEQMAHETIPATVIDTRSPSSPVAVREIDWSRVVGLVRPRA